MVTAEQQQADTAASSNNAVESALSMLGTGASPTARGVPARQTGHKFHRHMQSLASKPRTKQEVYEREMREQEKMEKAFLLDMRSEWLVAFLDATLAEAKEQARASADAQEESGDEIVERLQAEGMRWSSFLVELEKERSRYNEFA